MKEAFECSTKLERDTNPSRYLDKLIDIKDVLLDKYHYRKTPNDVIDQLIRVLGKDYDFIKTSLKREKRLKHNIDLSDLQEELEDKYREIKSEKKMTKQIKQLRVSDNSSEDEKEKSEKAMMAVQLSAASREGSILQDPENPNIAYLVLERNEAKQQYFNRFPKQFKGLCSICGVWGHKGADCTKPNLEPQLHTGFNNAPSPNCQICGSYFHNTRICWESKENAHRRPPNCRSRLSKKAPQSVTP